ncbi:DUF711 family protein, partial [Oenococcus oeni]
MDINKINETIQMISEEHFDIRTVTMGISLLDCIGGDGQRTAEKVHRKIVDKAGKLVETAQQLERDFGVPIVNKRISVTPVSLLAGNTDYDGLIKIARALDQAAADVGVDFLGGYSALIQKGSTPTEKMLIDSLPEVLSTTKLLMSSINIASTKAGINLNAVGKTGRTIKRISEVDPLGNAKLVVFANAVEDNP